MDLKDTFIKVLEWVGHNPLRLVILLVIGVFCMGAWFVYTEKDAFMASYRAQQALPHMNGKYEEATNFIIKRSDAEIVAIFDVNPLLNTRKLVSYISKSSGRQRNWDGMDVGLFTNNVDNNKDVVTLMSGDIACGPYLRPQSFLGFVYLDAGITYMCRVSVPPDPNKFIGQITVGWKTEPENLEQVKTVVRIASEILWN